MTNNDYNIWTIDEDEDIESLDVPIEYAITASPNDFNIKTLYDFIESSIINIPGFQRNYVWDINGLYPIQAKVKDTNGLVSSWGILRIEIPRTRATFNPLFYWFFERFPMLKRLLNL